MLDSFNVKSVRQKKKEKKRKKKEKKGKKKDKIREEKLTKQIMVRSFLG